MEGLPDWHFRINGVQRIIELRWWIATDEGYFENSASTESGGGHWSESRKGVSESKWDANELQIEIVWQIVWDRRRVEIDRPLNYSLMSQAQRLLSNGQGIGNGMINTKVASDWLYYIRFWGIFSCINIFY